MNMIRTTLLMVLLAITVSVFPQNGTFTPWTSTSKKAVKSIEKAMDLYQGNQDDKALVEVGKAIKADSSFIEAYMLMAEIAMQRGDDSLAIFALEYAVAIDQRFFPPNLYHLGNLYISRGEYTRALSFLNRYLLLPNKQEKTLASVQKSIATCHFAIDAMKNPVKFNPINLGEGVNSELDEYYPSLTVDELTLLFTRLDKDPSNADGFNENLYLSRFRDYLWQPSRTIGLPVNTRYNEGACAISPDGQIIVFTSCEIQRGLGYGQGRSGYGSCDLFFTYRNGDKWSQPQNLGAPVNSHLWESQPAFDANGKTLYFVRGVPASGAVVQNSDIFFSTIDDQGNWSVPKSVGRNINTDGNEEGVFIHPDGQTLYFSSDGHPGMGGYDIFLSRRQPDGSWGQPVNLGYPINTSKNETGFIVNASGTKAYFSSNRDGGFGGLDIYSFELDPSLRPLPVTYFKGVVYDAETTKPIAARFELINIATGTTVISSSSDPVTGDFILSLPTDQTYALNVNKENYLFYSDRFELKGQFSALKPFEKDIPLQPIRKGETVVLKNIFFDHDKFTLKPESMIELNRLADLLKKNPQIRIEIGGHTDNTGTRKYNETLSENRAKAVIDYLVTQGIQASRLSSRGYADTQPIADNNSEEGKALNRRTEFKITDH
jgi:outer membrane protein OmpA-like peptidoglycan-associated protein